MQKAKAFGSHLNKYVELHEIGHKIHAMQDKAHNFKEVRSTLPPLEVVTEMAENKKLYS